MDPVLSDSIRALEENNWWFVGMRDIARTLMAGLPRFERAVDMGCGSGGNLALLGEFARDVVALDVDGRALAHARARLGPRSSVRGLVEADAQRLPFASDSVDLVWLFNVIEHLPDDGAALSEAARVLRPGGWMVLATSAFMALWSDHDVANHHVRRYEARDLRRRIEGAGLRVRRLTHANWALFVPVAAVALAHRLRARFFGRPPYQRHVLEVNGALDKVLLGLLRAEARWLRHRDLPWGVSVFALAEKA